MTSHLRTLVRPLCTVTTVMALVLAAPVGSAAQAVEVGAWGGWSRSNEVTKDLEICTINGCSPTSMWPHFVRRSQTAGLMLRAELSRLLAVRAEAALAHKGFGPGDERSDRYIASRYVEMPLLLEVTALRLGPVALRGAGGLAPALLASCRASSSPGTGSVPECGSGDTDGPARDYDVGWVAAPGIAIALPAGSLMLELRHTRGMLDIRPDDHGRTFNRATTVTLGYARRVR